MSYVTFVLTFSRICSTSFKSGRITSCATSSVGGSSPFAFWPIFVIICVCDHPQHSACELVSPISNLISLVVDDTEHLSQCLLAICVCIFFGKIAVQTSCAHLSSPDIYSNAFCFLFFPSAVWLHVCQGTESCLTAHRGSVHFLSLCVLFYLVSIAMFQFH